MGTRNYTAATQAAIFAMSLKCYYPECRVPSVNILQKGEAKKNVQIAHIVSVSSDGPRYRRMPKEELNGFENLILLCSAHHPLVDNKINEHKYTEAVLHRWKQENETELRAKADGLERLTADDVEGMLQSAIIEAKKEILDAISELKEISKGAGELLGGLFAKIEDHYINEESVALLYAASQRLSYLEEGANMLYSASMCLENMEEHSHMLYSAADTLYRLEMPDYTSELRDVAEEIRESLRAKPHVPDMAGAIERAGHSVITEIEDKARSINLGETPTLVDDAQRWNFAFRGFAAGVLACVIFGICMLIWFNGAPA